MKEPLVDEKLALSFGLSKEEFRRIREHLGRRPNYTELGIYSLLWSEHCSYKSSKIFLKNLPTYGEKVLQGPGENAGVIDLGNEFCLIFKIESHNHPSFIEPYQGAATGVGGILRDIFSMGARPIASLNSLRFGSVSNDKTRYLLEGVVAGIADYGNCMGIPTVGGEIYFNSCYDGNILVNVFNLGIASKERIFKGIARGIGNPLIYVGSKTGRDGIHGATMASDIFKEDDKEKRPNVQIGDPFTEKLLLEACLEAAKGGDNIVGVQDLGAGGLSCGVAEMAQRGESGLEINIDFVPLREEGMTPYEIMLSESQERMLFVVKKGTEEGIKKIFKKWDLEAKVIGKVTDDRLLKVKSKGREVASIPVSSLTEDSPVYKRKMRKPAYLSQIKGLSLKEVPIPSDLNETLLRLLGSPNISSRKWVYEQYDHTVRTNTIIAPGSDSALIRIKGTNMGVGLTIDGNSRYCYLNPFWGAVLSTVEAARNLVSAGIRPLAISDCLNFGSPEDPEVMWQFAQCVKGMAVVARYLSTPIVSGNVSFYNQTADRSIYPTPVIAMVGVLDDLDLSLTQCFKEEGDIICLLGDSIPRLDGTEYLSYIFGMERGEIGKLDFLAEKNLHETVLLATRMKILHSAHDISEGGLAIALCEAIGTSCGDPLGVMIDLNPLEKKAINIRKDILLFGESPSRIIVSLAKNNLSALQDICRRQAVSLRVIGKVTGNRLRMGNLIDLAVDDILHVYDESFTKVLGLNL